MTRAYDQEAELILIEKAIGGDPDAFGELARRYYPGVTTVIYRLCGDLTLAEDMTQETFLRAWTNLSSFRPQGSLRSWLYRIAINATLDALRRRKETVEYDDELQPDEQTSNPEATLLASEQARQVQQAICSLPHAARAVLVLREYGGLSYQEIAAALHIPVGTVMSRLSYGRNCLRRSLTGLVQKGSNHA